MTESGLYLNFIKRNLLFLVLPVLIGFLTGSFLLSQTQNQTKISQSFKLVYNLQELSEAFTITDQAVEELRAQRFAVLYPSATVAIYKSGPFLINIDAVSEQKEAAYELLLKETTYLNQNFFIIEVNKPEIIQVEPSIIKYLLSGILVGLVLGVVASLLKEYFKNY